MRTIFPTGMAGLFVVLAANAFAQTEAPKGYTGAYAPAGTSRRPLTPRARCHKSTTAVQAWTWQDRKDG